jgi:hypothetical protein
MPKPCRICFKISFFMNEHLNIPRRDIVALLSEAVQIGFRKGLEANADAPAYISQNKAYIRYGRVRVQNWVKDGSVRPRYNGRGRNSTINYKVTDLMTLDAAERISIYKTQ